LSLGRCVASCGACPGATGYTVERLRAIIGKRADLCKPAQVGLLVITCSWRTLVYQQGSILRCEPGKELSFQAGSASVEQHVHVAIRDLCVAHSVKSNPQTLLQMIAVAAERWHTGGWVRGCFPGALHVIIEQDEGPELRLRRLALRPFSVDIVCFDPSRLGSCTCAILCKASRTCPPCASIEPQRRPSSLSDPR
jgi:hypothetical protein